MWGALFDRVHLFRERPTPAEAVLWECLRGRFPGVRFRRQHTIGRFIVDFFCWKHHLAVEVDGPIHDLNREYDVKRDQFLECQGLRVLRFSNDEVMTSLESVLTRIGEAIGHPPSPAPGPHQSSSPSPTGEGVRG